MANDILFWKGNKSDFTAIEHSSNTIYFVLDDLSIYVGDVEVSNNKFFFIETIKKRYQDIIDKFQWQGEVLYSITIVVKDEGGALLANIGVEVEGNRYTTDDNGECVVNVSKGVVVIMVENGLEYKEVEINVTEDATIQVVLDAPNKTHLVFSVGDGEVFDLGLSTDDFTEVDWGDGNIDSSTTQHTYEKGGLYDVVITHNRDATLYFGYNTNLKEIKSMGVMASMYSAFKKCTNLTTIHQGAFDNNVNATDFNSCFERCSSLTAIPQGLFDKNVNVTTFEQCFKSCSSLTAIPQGLFDKNVNVTDFNSCFNGCSSLTAIPQGLFDKNVNVTTFEQCFLYCISLTTIPEGLFDNNVNAVSFYNCFQTCNSLTTIPNGLFDKNVNAETFYSCFNGCTSLTAIPEGLFDNNVNVTDFIYAFNSCKSLTTIPKGLFDKNVNARSFTRCFNGCTSLSSIPEGLFDNNLIAYGYENCFRGCVSLDQPYNCTSPGLPKLWEREGTMGAEFSKFSNDTFYYSMPIPWGGISLEQ